VASCRIVRRLRKVTIPTAMPGRKPAGIGGHPCEPDHGSGATGHETDTSRTVWRPACVWWSPDEPFRLWPRWYLFWRSGDRKSYRPRRCPQPTKSAGCSRTAGGKSA
jgi:hypothetical protein